MIGSYMFPRVSVFLRPEDLEPTQELQQALQLVQATKDINNLRKLYTTFGHLFCHAVTLGGCLQTTKIVTGTQQSAETEEKEAFKASVGVAVSTVSPVALRIPSIYLRIVLFAWTNLIDTGTALWSRR